VVPRGGIEDEDPLIAEGISGPLRARDRQVTRL
jgi:hypothetical protein